MKSWSIIALSSILAACGGANPQLSAQAPPIVTLPKPTRAIHLRVAFDADPTVYVGRFVPSSVKPEDVDENAAGVTRCSKFIRPKVVDANQHATEDIFVSESAAASLGLPQLAQFSAEHQSARALRVQYDISKKIQSDVDADGLGRCCQADPSQCTGSYIGEFVMGSGSVLQSKEAQNQLGAKGITPQGISGGAQLTNTDDWRTVTTFKDVYFAFLTTAASQPSALASSDCSWCDNIPTDLDGKYFCGMSFDASNEAQARDIAMRNAREQVIKYLGESIVTASATQTSALKGILEDRQVVSAAAQGVASHVETKRWCPAERVKSPNGEQFVSKVLAYFPNTEASAAAAQVAEAAVASGKLTPEQQRAVRDAATKAR